MPTITPWHRAALTAIVLIAVPAALTAQAGWQYRTADDKIAIR